MVHGFSTVMLQASLRRRFIVLFISFGFCLAALYLLLRYLEHLDARDAVQGECDRKGYLAESWMQFRGESLAQFASDYAQWDEMVAFVQTPSKDWAATNLDASLSNFQVSACWVYRPDGTQVYEALHSGVRQIPAPPVALPAFQQRMRSLVFMHFFIYRDSRLIEYRVSPVQTSADVNRKGPPLGWFIVARTWDVRVLSSLANLSDSEVDFCPDPMPSPQRGQSMLWTCPMPGWDAAPVAYLRLTFSSPSLVNDISRDRLQLLMFLVFGGGVLLVFAYFIHRWVVLPLGQISEALGSRSSERLKPLLADQGEIGALARLVAGSFEQKLALEREVVERQRAETALRRSETSLRDSLHLRTELGRNLHDGVIQSLYASGISLATAEAQVQSAPAEALRILAETRALLNEVIRDVRNFIVGLEPESLSRLSFVDALRKVCEQMTNLGHCDFSLVVPELLAQQLPMDQRLQLLHILREGLSNAIRHGGATEISCRLRQEHGGLAFEIIDNGSGFDPGSSEGSKGRGLRNLMERSATMGGRLTLDSRLGEGTHLRVFIPNDGTE